MSSYARILKEGRNMGTFHDFFGDDVPFDVTHLRVARDEPIPFIPGFFRQNWIKHRYPGGIPSGKDYLAKTISEKVISRTIFAQRGYFNNTNIFDPDLHWIALLKCFDQNQNVVYVYVQVYHDRNRGFGLHDSIKICMASSVQKLRDQFIPKTFWNYICQRCVI